VVARVNKEKPLLQKQLKVLNEVLRIISSIDPGSINSGCPANSVVYKKYCYATMDYVKCSPSSNPGKCPHVCQRGFLFMPAGWQTVPHTSDIRLNVVGKHPFGTYCVYLWNSVSYDTVAQDPKGVAGNCGDTWIKSGNWYRARNCKTPVKVLMRRKVKNV